MINKIKNKLNSKSKKVLLVNLLLNAFVIIVLILQIFNKNWSSCYYCVMTLVLFALPPILSDKLEIQLPTPLEIIIYIFIFAAEMLGELGNFYNNFALWDKMLHITNGFLCAAIGFALIDVLNKSNKIKTHMTPLFVAFVGFCFSMTVGAVWEIIEYGSDKILKTDMQKDTIITDVSTVYLHPYGENKTIKINGVKYTIIYLDTDNDGEIDQEYLIENGYLDVGIIDTMNDIIVNLFGAIIFSTFGYLYLKNREKYGFVEGLIPTLKNE